MIIDRLLASGVKLWLSSLSELQFPKSQPTEVERLTVTIEGKDQQIMTGYIPEIFIAANTVIYQDISLSQVKIRGVNIRFNLREILKAQPFQLLEPISVTAQILLKESDLQASLASPLFLDGLKDFWQNLLQETNHNIPEKVKNYSIIWQKFSLKAATLKLTGTIDKTNSTVTIITGLSSYDSQTLLFSPITILGVSELATENNRSELAINLGNNVNISELKLWENQLSLDGTITIFPA